MKQPWVGNDSENWTEPTTAYKITELVVTEEFQPLSRARKTIFLPSTIFPNTDRRITQEEANSVFHTLHEINGRVCDEKCEADRKELRDALNSVLDETRRYTRTRICQPKEVEACRHWGWKTNGRLVESNDDIDAILRSKWETNKATMIIQCHTIMHGLYKSKRSIGWFSKGLQRFLNLKRIKLYTTDAHGNKKILEENNVGRLLSFAKQARTKTNRDRNSSLNRFQGIQIFSGKRAKFATDHTDRKQVNPFDAECHGYYIETKSRPNNAKKTLASLLSEGHTEKEILELIREIKREGVASIPATVNVNEAETQEDTRPPKAVGKRMSSGSTQKKNSREAYEAEELAFKNALKGGTDGAEVDSLSLDLEMDDDILLGPLSPTKIVMDKQMNIRKEDSPRGSNGNASSDGGTETDYSSSVSPNNVRQKNINQLQHFLKPKEKKKEQKKGTQKKKEATQGTRRSPRNSTVNHDSSKECKGDVELPNKTPTARRALQVRHNTLMLQPTPLTKTLVSFHSSKQSGQSQLVNQ